MCWFWAKHSIYLHLIIPNWFLFLVGGVAEYRASEGKTVQIPFRGDVEFTMRDILGGVRSTCTYVGAGKLKELSRRTTFIRVTQQLNEVYSNKDNQVK